MRKRLLFSGLLAAIILTVLVLPVFAQSGGGPGKLIFGGEYTLESGQTLHGDLGILGGAATLEEGSKVLGDVLLAGGSLRASGTIEGDVAIFGGSLDLTSGAEINGDIANFGGSLRKADGAVITGDVLNGAELGFPGFRGFPFGESDSGPATVIEDSPPAPGEWLLRQLLRLVRAVGLTLAFSALALVLSMLWPRQVKLVGETVLDQPILAFAVGLLTLILAGGVIAILTITICLLPLALILALALLAAVILAWIATGWIVGRKLFQLAGYRDSTVVLEATVGTLIVVMLYFLISLIPCLDFLFGAIVASLGLGAVLLTRFGSQPYQPAGKRPRPPAPPAPALPPVADPAEAAEPGPPAAELNLADDVLAKLAEADAAKQVDAGAEAGDPAIRSAADLGLPPAAEARAAELTAEAPTFRGAMGEPISEEPVAAPTLREGQAKDDLTRIDDIGPVFAGRLREAGITSFADLAAADPADLGERIKVNPGRIRRKDWIGQAKNLA